MSGYFDFAEPADRQGARAMTYADVISAVCFGHFATLE